MSENDLNQDDYYYTNFTYGEDFFEGILQWTGEIHSEQHLDTREKVYLFKILYVFGTNIEDWKEGWPFYLPISDLVMRIDSDISDITSDTFREKYPELFI